MHVNKVIKPLIPPSECFGRSVGQLEWLKLLYEGMIAEYGFQLLSAVKYVKLTWLRWNSNSTCCSTYWMRLPSFNLISQSKLKKGRKSQIRGRADGHCHGIHDDVIKWKQFPRYWPFGRGIHRSSKASDAELWCFLWSEVEQTILRLVIWDAIALIMTLL